MRDSTTCCSGVRCPSRCSWPASSPTRSTAGCCSAARATPPCTPRASTAARRRAWSARLRPSRGSSGRSRWSRTRSAARPGARPLREPLRLVLAQEALEQAAMALLVAKDVDDHVLRDGVAALAELDDLVVVLDRARLGLDHALDHMDDVGLVVGRLEVRLLGVEVE